MTPAPHADAEDPAPAAPLRLVPHMGEHEFAIFDRILGKSTVYLEYGSGGSTAHAAQRGVPTIVSVESDPAWAGKVRQATAGSASDITVHVCDIGEVARWGRPKDKAHYTQFHRYATLPWQQLRERGQVPDLVLVDGRFRVASFLYSLLCAAPDTRLLFDDYADRPQYHVVEQFCPLRRMHGRMALFRRPQQLDLPPLVESFARYSVITE
jgi:hypothetical protein